MSTHTAVYQWQKKGLLIQPDSNLAWQQSHAQVPVVDVVDAKTWHIYYASRDAQNRCRIGWVEVPAGQPETILRRATEPVLDLGPLGAFDECGVMPTWVIRVEGAIYLYYIGWSVPSTVPYQNAIGLAISRDGGQTFTRAGAGPLFGLTLTEPYFTGTACILYDDGLYKNWYLSCTGWHVINGKPEARYHLKYAESPDGISWNRTGHVAIDYQDAAEGGIVKASVLRDAHTGQYRMWYATRALDGYRTEREAGYRLGYAESADGKQWTRQDDQVGITVSETGWDSQMMAYPHVVRHADQLYLFYNGNGFGKEGFGYALCNDPRHSS